ncbi:MAG: prepilin peptidase [Pseudomonadota bacterium]
MTGFFHHPLTPCLVATVAALATFAAALTTGADLANTGWTALLFAILASLAWIDAVSETVPDVLTVALVFTGLAHASAVGAAVLPIGAAAVLLLTVGVLHGRITGDLGWIGSGDYFLAAGVVAWFGPTQALEVLALTTLGLLFHSLIARRASIALAPSLAAAAALTWVGGPIL